MLCGRTPEQGKGCIKKGRKVGGRGKGERLRERPGAGKPREGGSARLSTECT